MGLVLSLWGVGEGDWTFALLWQWKECPGWGFLLQTPWEEKAEDLGWGQREMTYWKSCFTSPPPLHLGNTQGPYCNPKALRVCVPVSPMMFVWRGAFPLCVILYV